PGREGYSFAHDMTARGFTVIALDNIGTGASSRPPDADVLTFESVARVLAAVADQIRLLPALGDDPVRLVGVGHSLRGMLVAVQQGVHGSFDRVAVRGSQFARDADDPARAGADPRVTAAAMLEAQDPAGWRSGYLRPPRSGLRPFFHAADVPDD